MKKHPGNPDIRVSSTCHGCGVVGTITMSYKQGIEGTCDVKPQGWLTIFDRNGGHYLCPKCRKKVER